MDERLSNALEFANYSHTLFNQKKLAHQKFIDSCVHYHNAGKFTITQELVAVCLSHVSVSRHSFVLLDDNNVPIQVTDPGQFLKTIQEKYSNALADYYTEYQKIIAAKKVQGIVDD